MGKVFCAVDDVGMVMGEIKRASRKQAKGGGVLDDDMMRKILCFRSLCFGLRRKVK